MTALTHRTKLVQQDMFSDSTEAPDDATWPERAAHWLLHKPKRGRGRPRRGEFRKPLILSGHGIHLNVQHGALVVQNGFTHYPQTRETWRLFPGDRKLPTRIVILDANGSLSFDVLAWLSVQNIPLVQINWQGEVVTIGSQRPPDNKLYEAQLAARGNGAGFALATRLVRDKIAASVETLHTIPISPAGARGFTQLARGLKDLDRGVAKTIEELRLVEGRAALAYFRSLQKVPIRWKGTRQKPIPDNWHFVPLRQSGKTGTNRQATHPFNAMLNYAYGVLESRVRIDTVAAGLDPTIGYLHAAQPGRVALVYDLMEPMRPVVDGLILNFIADNELSPADFTLAANGVCRLHPQLAKAICRQMMTFDPRVTCFKNLFPAPHRVIGGNARLKSSIRPNRKTSASRLLSAEVEILA